MTTHKPTAVEAACRAHAPHWDQIDEDIRAYARDQMHAAIAAYEQERAKDEAVACRYRFHENEPWRYAERDPRTGHESDGRVLIEFLYTRPSPAADVKALREALSLFIKTRKEWAHATNRVSEHVAKMKFLRACEVLAALATSGGGE